MKIYYAAGPGDIVSTFEHWKKGEEDPSQVAKTYSSLFYDFVRRKGDEALAVSSFTQVRKSCRENITVESAPKPDFGEGLAAYFFSQVAYGMITVWNILRFRANVAVISESTSFWFVFLLLPLFGVKVVPALHCVLWPLQKRPSLLKRILHPLDKLFFRFAPTAVMSLSQEITGQVRELGGKDVRVESFLPVFRKEVFEKGAKKQKDRYFKVFFAGRIERNKGVYDLLQICREVQKAGVYGIEFDLCGDGSELKMLQAEAQSLKWSSLFRLHGHCKSNVMREFLQNADVVIVPTRSDFVEGMNKVVIEGVLAGKPVITSSVCPALHYVREAAMEVPVDDVLAYKKAIFRLMCDRDLYYSKCEAARQIGKSFFDKKNSWSAALERILRSCDA